VDSLNKPQKTVERWIKILKDKKRIIFKGNSKIGGYYEENR